MNSDTLQHLAGALAAALLAALALLSFFYPVHDVMGQITQLLADITAPR